MNNLNSNASRFYNKSGSLTRYALACGYLETYKKDETNLSIGAQHGTYQVHGFSKGRWVWQCYRTLTEARAAFRKLR